MRPVHTMASPRRAQRMPRQARLSARQVNLVLEVLLVAALGTGLASWAIGTRWARAIAVVHGIAGLTLLVLAPAKYRRSVRAGLRRRRPTRFVSIAFGVFVVGAVILGVLHATGIWYGVGWWSALWPHTAAAFVLVPVFVWHLLSRPVRPRRT